MTCDQCSGDFLCLSYGGMGGGVVGWKCRLSVQGTTVFSLHNDSLLHPTTREPRRVFSNRLHNEGHMTISYVTIPVIAVTHGVFWRHSLSKLLHIIRTVRR